METLNFSSISKSSIEELAIGGFDGVHFAHQQLIKKLHENRSAVVVIENGHSNLTPQKNRVDYIKLPMVLFELNDIKALEGQEFVAQLKELFPNLKKLIVGYDFHFGKDRAWSAYDLKKMFDGKVEIVEEVKLDHISVHSKIIRQHLINGDIEIVSKLLNHHYKIRGEHIKGQGIGKTEFVPTINIETSGYLMPKEGVYVTKSTIESQEYNSITFLGHRVTTDGSFAIETYILDEKFNQDVDYIEIEFYSRLRDNQKFDTYQELKIQIEKDIENARVYLRTNKS